MRKSIYKLDQIDALLSGKGMAILGRYDSTDEITDPVEGGHYYIGTEEPYDVYTYVNGAWVNAGPLAIEGPPGPAFTYDDFTPEQLAGLRGEDGKSPYINASTNNWMVWDEEKGSFVDSGVNAGGKAPSIGANGNWFIDGVDTGVPATNAQLVEEARKYAEAAATNAANAGRPPYIGENGNWFVWDMSALSFVDTGKRAKGVTVTKVDTSSLDDGRNLVTFSDGSTLSVKNGSKGSKGDPGDSITVKATDESSEDGGNNVVTFSDGSKLNVKNGGKGSKGDKGDSVYVSSVEESTEDGGSNVVVFSDGKSMTVKNGGRGSKGDKGDAYELTDADRTEIAEQVSGTTIIQAPKYVASVDEMTDTSKSYVMKETGHIWAYMDTTTEKEVTITDEVVGTTDNPYQVGRLGSSGSVSSDVSTHVVSPYIDLTKAEYQGKTIQIHLEGNRYASQANETYIMAGTYDANKAVIVARAYVSLASDGILVDFDNAGMTIEVLGETSAVITIPVPLISDGNKTVGFMRFCGKGTEAASNIYVTYKGTQTVTGGQWVDTGLIYNLTEEDKLEIAEDVAAMIDTQLLGLIGSGEVTV